MATTAQDLVDFVQSKMIPDSADNEAKAQAKRDSDASVQSALADQSLKGEAVAESRARNSANLDQLLVIAKALLDEDSTT